MTTSPPTSSSPAGTVTVDADGLATITFVRRLAHPVATVWAALTDPSERAGWLGASTVDGRPGGTIETVADDPPVDDDLKRMTGRILTWDPPRVLEHEWHQAVLARPTVVRYELAADGDATVLTFVHRELTESDADGFVPGTHAYLDRLEAQLAGDPPPRWGARYAEVAPLYG
jgi:uncharacterized protein YndB with AHSA1/START domain